MKKLFTAVVLSCGTLISVWAQNVEFHGGTHDKIYQYVRTPQELERLERIKHQTLSSSRVGGTSRSTSTCDSGFSVDYSMYEYYYVNTFSPNLTYNGTWYVTAPQIRAREITGFIDSIHEELQADAYVTVDFDSIAFVGQDNEGNEAFRYIPLSIITAYIDSVNLRCGLSADTAHLQWNNQDSLIIKIQQRQGSTFNTLYTRAFVGADLAPYQTEVGFLNPNTTLPIGYQLAQGQSFAIRVEFKGADTTRHFLLSYGYTDSCGTVPGGYTSPAKKGLFAPNDYYGVITGTNSIQELNNQLQFSTNQLPGVPANCRYMYEQNFDIVPILNLCYDYNAIIEPVAPNTTDACAGSVIPLEAVVVGTTASNATYEWSVSGNGATLATESSVDDPTNTLTVGNGNAIVYLKVTDSDNNIAYDTLNFNVRAINVAFPSSPYTIECADGASSVTLSPTVTGVTTGRTNYWSNNGATTGTLSVNFPGTYPLTVTNTYGCSASASAVVQYPNGINNNVNFNLPSGSFCLNQAYSIVNGSSSKDGWSSIWIINTDTVQNPDGVYDLTNYVFTIQGPNVIKLIMDSSQCLFVSPSKNKSVSTSGCTIGIDDITFSNSINLMPNPANANVTIEIANVEKNISVVFYDILGATVKSFSSEANGQFKKTFNVSDFASGTYIVKITSGGQTATKRLVVSK